MYPFPRPGDAAEAGGSAGPDLDITAWIARLDANERLAELVVQALSGDRQVRGRYVDVAVQNGVVTLRGELDSDSARAAARQRVWTLPGVRDVCDMLTSPGQTSTPPEFDRTGLPVRHTGPDGEPSQ
ncbi:BON domain-containing protein [Actinoplanes solisilvae]|uniref:BON domain-containing protein n=1 Tax=Actinoplanes solisilvae TaxID=2486853 RepID=UPI000FDB8DFA|nr:BON domain-containing protein [Actinoplanes solisilvae]